MPTLTIELPGSPPVTHVLKDETITIGRMRGNTVVIEDASISLMHARITRRGAQCFLKDLNSTNGTLVNGQPVREVLLHHSDRVRFADVTCRFEVEPELAALPTPTQTTSPSPAVGLPLEPPSIGKALTAGQFSSENRPVSPPIAKLPPAPGKARARVPWLIRFMPYLGGFAILVVLSIFTWRAFHLQDENKSTQPLNSQTLIAQARARSSHQQTRAPEPKPSEAAPIPEANPLSSLLQELKSQDAATRRLAAAALHSLGPKARPAHTALREALKDSDNDVQMWAALTLINNQAYDKASVPICIRVLSNTNSMLRQVACLSLGLMPHDDSDKKLVLPALAQTAQNDVDPEVRQAALSALGVISPESISAAR